ncbi:DNA replication and repair protein RecF [Reichenbachiella agariperforans]|uniref:DNA replication and repair protein RecF n=1 Tax=Reichenbachiella agariperforans TaxID=156994 RepID=A0A1M6TMM0_REIAG|nr:DNA replication/repair protein RecF [Reichenbachiella agariperforans]SHK58038.1 DNA replication and repair protein RecF [Reichenbachiella agariperforans]
MFLQSLKLSNFKNYLAEEAVFCEHVNCFVGLNGSGKTNLLDAIYYLSLTKSAFNTIDSQNIRHAESFFLIKGEFKINNKSSIIQCSLKAQEKKTFKVDGQEYDKLSQHMGKYPVVMIAPNDDELIRESNEVRRRFFDSIISQYDPEYLQVLIKYNHHLKQRNAALKQFKETRQFNATLLDNYDAVLTQAGKVIAEKRKAFLLQYQPYFQNNYDELADQKENVTIDYSSKALEVNFKELFMESRDKDRIMLRTLVGTHRDEFILKINGKPLKKFGSQGQQKSTLISLKLAQFEFIKAHLNLTPILLLDDIFDKLDDERIQKLLDIISSDRFGQIFITDAREERTRDLLIKKFEALKIFKIDAGQMTELT